MNIELATHAEMTARDTRHALAELMLPLKEAGANEELRLAIASAVWEIGLIIDKLYELYPELKRD